jgi:hypothetical protein
MLVAVAAFVIFAAAAVAVTRLRDVVRLAVLCGAAWAGHAADWRTGLLTCAVPALLAILAVEGLGLRSPVIRLAAQDRGRAVELLGEDDAGQLMGKGERTEGQGQVGSPKQRVGKAA